MANRKHLMAGTSIYKTWCGFRKRCNDPGDKNYGNYGGRGITVCDRWNNSFENFYADMGSRPPGMTLDRRDNDGPYSPENCRWATKLEQTRNRRVTNFVTHQGITLPLPEWCERAGVDYETTHNRLFKHGWSLEKALSAPVRRVIRGRSAAAAPEVLRLRVLGLKQRDIAAATGLSQSQVARVLSAPSMETA
jgi:hypothetical protein